MRFCVFSSDPLLKYYRKGEIKPRYWNPLNMFDEVCVFSFCDEDVTAVYQQTRRRVFESCNRVKIIARPGEAFIVHRLALHGMAPWVADVTAGGVGALALRQEVVLPV